LKKWISVLILTCLMFIGLGIKPSLAAVKQLVIINKSTNQLAYYENAKLIKVFKVGTGRKPSYTPEGKFKIVNKIVNRPYYTGGIPGGDPRNPLGNRWLGINARGTWGTTYAIHGNNDPSSIGKYVSSGCIRMYDNEVEWLFDRIIVNTPVVITTSGKSFNSIAIAYGYIVTGTIPTPPTSVGILKIGNRGDAVKKLQQKLTSIGYSTKGIDGIFGYNTDQAVRKFQKDRHLVVDGVVGPATIKALGGL
jgi:L,D-transpeptidase catalytic domain/Putative peptidoglycan binding domain